MSKIWIFGDSFSDENYVFNDHKNWYDFFEQRTNFSLHGIGSTFLIKKILLEMKQTNVNLSDIDLIIFLPDPYRLDLDYLPEPSYSANAKNFFDSLETKNQKSVYELKKIKDTSFYEKNMNRIIDNYLNFYELGLNPLLPLFTLTTILHISKYFKSTIIWPTNYMYSNNDYTEQIGVDFSIIYDNLCQTDNFYLITTPLLKISFDDMNTDINSHFFHDDRNNHLSENSHLFVSNIIGEWLNNKKRLI